MAKFEIDEKLAQDVLNYLAERPFKEVMAMIPQLMQLKKIEEPVKPQDNGEQL